MSLLKVNYSLATVQYTYTRKSHAKLISSHPKITDYIQQLHCTPEMQRLDVDGRPKEMIRVSRAS